MIELDLSDSGVRCVILRSNKRRKLGEAHQKRKTGEHLLQAETAYQPLHVSYLAKTIIGTENPRILWKRKKLFICTHGFYFPICIMIILVALFFSIKYRPSRYGFPSSIIQSWNLSEESTFETRWVMLSPVHQWISWYTVIYFNLSYFSISLLFFLLSIWLQSIVWKKHTDIFNHILSFLCFMMF